jgi:hypothetical protein
MIYYLLRNDGTGTGTPIRKKIFQNTVDPLSSRVICTSVRKNTTGTSIGTNSVVDPKLFVMDPVPTLPRVLDPDPR